MCAEFINAFVIKDKRQRYLAKEKGNDLIDKLCHHWESVIDKKWIVEESDIKYKEIAGSLATKKSFCICRRKEFNRMEVSVNGPTEIDDYFPVILVYSEKLAWFKTESTPRSSQYILTK